MLFVFFYALSMSAGLGEISKNYKNISKVEDSINLAEKVFVHFDKPYYSSGEFMWFKVYLVNGKSNRPNAQSKIVHVDLINPTNEIVSSRAVKIDVGGGAGEFPLPLHLKTGWYSIRAYSNVMRNLGQDFFFHKRIKILALNEASVSSEIVKNENPVDNLETTVVSAPQPDVQFFPEGGQLVEGLLSDVAIKSMDESGRSVAISGYIVESNGNNEANFHTLKLGFGKFSFTPKKGEVYKAIVDYKGQQYTYDMPIPLDKGVVIRVKDEENNYVITLSSSLEEGINGLTLIGHQRGDIVSIANLSGLVKRGVVIVPKSNLQEGVVQFAVFNEKKQPLCERLSFVKNIDIEQNLIAIASKPEFHKRELVEIEVSLDGGSNKFLESNTSVAVTDVSIVDPDSYGLDIRSQLLLNSELRGEIENPGYYFYSSDPNKEKMLDLLMLTQGWRKFLWNDPAMESHQNLRYTFEKGITFSGTVKNFYNRNKIENSDLSLTFHNNSEFGQDEVTTFENGRFIFGDYHFADSTDIVIQAKTYKLDKKTNQRKNKEPWMGYYIELDSFEPPEVLRKQPLTTVFKGTFDDTYLERSKTRYHFDTIHPFVGDYVKLDEVELAPVKAKEKKNYNERTFLYNDPSYRADFDELEMRYTGSPLLALQGLFPGVTILGSRGEIVNISRGPVSIAGASPPLFILNGMITDVDVIINLPISEISWIDIIKGYRASIWGSRASNGVLAVYTKDGADKMRELALKERTGIINFVYPGYYKARKFYEPNYETIKPEHDYPDYRSTIHWNPELRIDSKGGSKISFYAADLRTTYKVEIQGVTSKGGIIKKELFIDVN